MADVKLRSMERRVFTLEAVNLDQKLYYHVLGTPQTDDRLVYARPDQPEWGFGGSVTEDGTTLVVFIWQGTEEKNRISHRGRAVARFAAFLQEKLGR